jgi:hypothetical protein
MPTGGAVAQGRGNQTALELAAWAKQLGGAEPHSPEAAARSGVKPAPQPADTNAWANRPGTPKNMLGPGADTADLRDTTQATPWKADAISSSLAAWERRYQDPSFRAATPIAQPRTSPLAPGSPGRDVIRLALDMRDAREDDEGVPPAGSLSPEQSAAFNAANRQYEAHTCRATRHRSRTRATATTAAARRTKPT